MPYSAEKKEDSAYEDYASEAKWIKYQQWPLGASFWKAMTVVEWGKRCSMSITQKKESSSPNRSRTKPTETRPFAPIVLMFLFEFFLSHFPWNSTETNVSVAPNTNLSSNGKSTLSGPKMEMLKKFFVSWYAIWRDRRYSTRSLIQRILSITYRFWQVVSAFAFDVDSVCMKCKQRFPLTNLISFCSSKMTMQTMKVLLFPLIGLCIALYCIVLYFITYYWLILRNHQKNYIRFMYAQCTVYCTQCSSWCPYFLTLNTFTFLFCFTFSAIYLIGIC